ncbi:hypothetical protein P7K49_036817, partial [Saguinus oedipus]
MAGKFQAALSALAFASTVAQPQLLPNAISGAPGPRGCIVSHSDRSSAGGLAAPTPMLSTPILPPSPLFLHSSTCGPAASPPAGSLLGAQRLKQAVFLLE